MERDSGVWSCLLDDRGEVVGKYVFLSVEEEGRKGLKILQEDGLDVVAAPGRGVELVCHTNVRPGKDEDRPRCIWYSPYGSKYDIVGRSVIAYVICICTISLLVTAKLTRTTMMVSTSEEMLIGETVESKFLEWREDTREPGDAGENVFSSTVVQYYRRGS